MKLYHLVLKDILRRKKRVLYAAAGIVIATMTVVGILTIAMAGQAKIYDQLEKYGANVAVMPAISNIDMSLGDLRLGALTVGENYIPEARLPEIRQIADGEIRKALGIKDEADIATISPKLYINTEVKGTSLMMVGIEPREERTIKTWWKIREGNWIEGRDQVLLGALTAQVLQLNIGDKIPLNGSDATVVGILEETGSSDDYQVLLRYKRCSRTGTWTT